MAKKHPFHCGVCNEEVMIYRKGKGHRVMICHNCDRIVAVNGILKPVLKRTGKAILGEIPGASAVMEGIGLVKDIKRQKAKKTQSGFSRMEIDNLDKPNYPKGAYYIDKVI